MGIFISVSVILIWALHLAYMLLGVPLSADNPWMYLHILVQGYLFTGLFITAHDAMHGNVSSNNWVNIVIGYAASFLFAGMSYKRLRKNHGLHHKHSASEGDPDFYTRSQNYFRWLGIFIWRYVTLLQIVVMAIFFQPVAALTRSVRDKGLALLGASGRPRHAPVIYGGYLLGAQASAHRKNGTTQGPHAKEESPLGNAKLLFFRLPSRAP